MAGFLKWDGWLEKQNPNPHSGTKDHALLGASEALTCGRGGGGGRALFPSQEMQSGLNLIEKKLLVRNVFTKCLRSR